jgi:hypothetical protein
MARPEFWQAEDFAAFNIPQEDDADYRWVLRDFEWVPAKISPGSSAREFIATTSNEAEDPFECKDEDIFEAIPSVAGLGRLPDDLVHADDMSERSIVHTLSEVTPTLQNLSLHGLFRLIFRDSIGMIFTPLLEIF